MTQITISLKELVEFYQTEKSHRCWNPEQCIQVLAEQKYGAGTKLGGVKFTSQIVSEFTEWFAPYDGPWLFPTLDACIDHSKIHQLVNSHDAEGELIYLIVDSDFDVESKELMVHNDHEFWLQFFASLLALHPNHVFHFNTHAN